MDFAPLDSNRVPINMQLFKVFAVLETVRQCFNFSISNAILTKIEYLEIIALSKGSN